MICSIIGHWHSCNLGDKFQPFAIANYILTKSSIFGTWNDFDPNKLRFINFSNTSDNSTMHFQFLNKNYTIFPPETLLQSEDVTDVAIVTTGSLYSYSQYVLWISQLLNDNKIKKLIIWGGFSIQNQPIESYISKLTFLKDDRITYFARSHTDLMLFHRISNSNNCYLAGDPMCWFSDMDAYVFGSNFITDNNKEFEHLFDIGLNKIIAIPSVYSFLYNKSFWTEICEKADIIIYVDTYADRDLPSKYPNKSFILYEPWLINKIIKGAKHVISARLHGAVLASCMGIPTTMIITDDAEPNTGTFKFDAVGNHACGFQSPICNVQNTKSLDFLYKNPPKIPFKNILKYRTATFESLELILSYLSHTS